MTFNIRLATRDDVPAIKALMTLSMAGLLKEVLDPEQVKRSHDSMGLDTQLIEDGTYFLVYDKELLVGCGGWSRRRTLFGGNHTKGRDNSLADPASEPAKIRAMYTHPDHIRRGIGRTLLELGEEAAIREGFKTAVLGSTASGLPLYARYGYEIVKDISVVYDDGVIVPNILMRKTL